MVLRKCQTQWRERLKKEHRCFKKFINSLNAETSQESYGYKIQKFMKFACGEGYVKHVEDFEGLLTYDSEKITDLLEDYVDFLQENKTANVGTDLASPELFFTMNRKIWHHKMVRKGIKKLNRKKGGSLPIEDEELEKVYFDNPHPRKRCIISLLSCLGIRPGALIDPVLKFKHLEPIEDCYGVMIYDDSEEGYWGIIIPEARKDLERYKVWREKRGETITDDSPLIATLPSRWNATRNYVTDENLSGLVAKMIRGKVQRKKMGNRNDKAVMTMFRKRFNTKLKLNNQVNSNVAELVMAHKLPGAQGTYTKPTLREVYEAIQPSFKDLTIDPRKRKQIELDIKTEENKLLKDKVTEEVKEAVIQALYRKV